MRGSVSADMRPGQPHSLIHDRNFLIFWAGQTFSVLGDAIALIALPLLVLEATDSVARMGQITAVHGLGALAAGLAAGPAAARRAGVDRRLLVAGAGPRRRLALRPGTRSG